MTKRTSLLPIVRSYFEKDPAQAAHSLETMPETEAVEVLKALPPALTAKAFPHLPISYSAILLEEVPADIFRQIVEKLEPQQGASLFLHLSNEARLKFLDILPENLKKQVQEYLVYPEESAGRILSTDFLAFHMDLKVKEAIQKIRNQAKKNTAASYSYVMDAQNHLVGVINMRDLILASGEETLEQVMRRDIFSVNGFMDREKVADELTRKKFFAVPVVDNEGRLLGVIRAEQLIGDVQEEATEDLQRMFGAGKDERAFSPIGFSIRKRLPWLYVNLGTAFLAAAVVALFENVIARLTVLAIFMPVIAGQGGNAGAQSLAVVMRGIVMREIPKEQRKQLILKETLVGAFNGLAIGVVVGLVAWGWQENPMMGLVVGLAMLVNLLVAGFTGAAIPLIMKAVGLDPAQCSNIVLTTFTDCMGFFALLGFAVVFQPYLM